MNSLALDFSSDKLQFCAAEASHFLGGAGMIFNFLAQLVYPFAIFFLQWSSKPNVRVYSMQAVSQADAD